MLTRDQLLSRAAIDVAVLERQEVELPSGGTVLIRVMTAGELDRWEQEVHATRKEFDGKVPNWRSILAVRCICDDSGKRLFEDGEAELLSTLPAPDVDAIYDECLTLNRIQQKKEDTQKN